MPPTVPALHPRLAADTRVPMTSIGMNLKLFASFSSAMSSAESTLTPRTPVWGGTQRQGGVLQGSQKFPKWSRVSPAPIGPLKEKLWLPPGGIGTVMVPSKKPTSFSSSVPSVERLKRSWNLSPRIGLAVSVPMFWMVPVRRSGSWASEAPGLTWKAVTVRSIWVGGPPPWFLEPPPPWQADKTTVAARIEARQRRMRQGIGILSSMPYSTTRPRRLRLKAQVLEDFHQLEDVEGLREERPADDAVDPLDLVLSCDAGNEDDPAAEVGVHLEDPLIKSETVILLRQDQVQDHAVVAALRDLLHRFGELPA